MTRILIITKFADPSMIWIVGSSLIRRAYQHVQQRPVGDNLSLDQSKYNVIWVGHSGLQFYQVYGICQALGNSSTNIHPAYLIIHAGGNDIGRIRGGLLRYNIKQTIRYLQSLFPSTCIIWSCILPRLQWRHSHNTKAMENIRTRINREIIKFTVENGGRAIKHPDFNDKAPGLFADACHLSFIGNDIFINTLQCALYTFINSLEVKVYPVDS